MLACLAPTALLAEPQTQPTTQSAEDLRDLITRLDDRSAQIRDETVEQLMGLPSNQLDRLKSAVADSQPISAHQATELHRIVEQVYLSGHYYAADPGDAPFLGLFWPLTNRENYAPDSPIRVVFRLPGFDSNRLLRDGDTIVAVGEEAIATPTRKQFMDLIAAHKPGDLLKLTLERHGNLVAVVCQLRPRPEAFNDRNPDTDPVNTWVEFRTREAEEYWQANFAKLVANRPAI